MYFEYRIVKIEKGLFLIEYKTAPYGVWHEVEDKKFKTKPKAEAWARFVKMILCTFIFGKSFLKRMDGHVIALKENVLGKSGMNTKNTLSLCDVIIF